MNLALHAFLRLYVGVSINGRPKNRRKHATILLRSCYDPYFKDSQKGAPNFWKSPCTISPRGCFTWAPWQLYAHDVEVPPPSRACLESFSRNFGSIFVRISRRSCCYKAQTNLGPYSGGALSLKLVSSDLREHSGFQAKARD